MSASFFMHTSTQGRNVIKPINRFAILTKRPCSSYILLYAFLLYLMMCSIILRNDPNHCIDYEKYFNRNGAYGGLGLKG